MTHKVFDMRTSAQFVSLDSEAYLKNEFVLSKDPQNPPFLPLAVEPWMALKSTARLILLDPLKSKVIPAYQIILEIVGKY